MSQYRYSPLSKALSSIRLLRLMANDNEGADIACELFECSLEVTGKGTHLYEALSYAWGDPNKTIPIFIGKRRLHVTENLHKALVQLRDPSLPRIIWIDAICINQTDDHEKELQIQFMARIYGQASRAIVWLGEAADNSDQAIEDIRAIAYARNTAMHSFQNPFQETIEGEIEKAILKLLQRSWFRRIWVLQEVASARHVLIICGSMEIDGFAFCLGVGPLIGHYSAHPDVQGLIDSIMYLIRGTIFRPKYSLNTSSLEICPLGRLIDMYHTHEATRLHDKVYALLGMSSDNPSRAGLSPNYGLPWKELLKRLMQHLLSDKAIIESWPGREKVLIKCKGCILGQVPWIENAAAFQSRQTVNIKFIPTVLQQLGIPKSTQWNLPASAKSIQGGDLVCILEGNSMPTIIRMAEEHFSIILIAATGLEELVVDGGGMGTSDCFRSMAELSREFLLVWDWGASQTSLDTQKEYEVLETPSQEQNSWGPAKDDCLTKTTRLWNIALILIDLHEHEEAEIKLRASIEVCKMALGNEHPATLTGMNYLALLYKEKRQWSMAQKLFERVFETRKRVQGLDHPDTLSTMANLASINQEMGHTRKSEKLKAMIDILQLTGDGRQVADNEAEHIAISFDVETMKLLLDRKKGGVTITKYLVKAATWNRYGKDVMALLLKQHDMQVTEDAVIQLAESFDEKLMSLLLERKKSDHISENILAAAAVNKKSGLKILALLISQFGDKMIITEKVIKLAARNEKNKLEIWKLLRHHQNIGLQITKDAIKAMDAIENRWDSGNCTHDTFLQLEQAEAEDNIETLGALNLPRHPN